MSQSLKKIPVEVGLYEKSDKIYPREAKGKFQNFRVFSVYALLGLYYVLPWINWGERQAVLFDLPARKFHIFFLTFWPQDFFFLTLLLILAGLSLFFFTAIAGRVWCGFACPQTVWTEAFVWMERWVEGTRAQQIKLAAAPWTFNKIRKRVTKQVLWITFALFTGLTFVGYFQSIDQLFVDFFNFNIGGWSLFWVLFYGFATYGNAGFMREQVCKYMCPYARFQSAMFDRDTLIVAYDQKRGEPRSRGKKRKDAAEDAPAGDCIDCGICVQVCPTGIDIRDGLQYECIACAACIDGCDEVMERIGLPTGLIKYSTESQDSGDKKTLLQTVFRPRVLIYGTLLSIVFIGFITALAMRSTLQVDVLRDRNAFYRWADNGEIENTYQIRVMNKSQFEQHYKVGVTGLDNADVRWAKALEDGQSRAVAAGEIGEFTAIVSLPANADHRRSQSVKLTFAETEGEKPSSITEESRFWGPANVD
ncbi:cytochrome c oxidase accessory protein CcoG [Arenicella xantha]|uniref:Cytochrome c oxidase accessory protein FixG n=1 Tax=Arenicella xantha TaxID=644221 RepID=A0A395JLH1_9GAMM|nr:cytochrome c oxidase accessory protein CcoG [Arenicella xantha]RBP50697.1 cytochrome c oxidase accessory protein FixG [Arenicella xantha]